MKKLSMVLFILTIYLCLLNSQTANVFKWNMALLHWNGNEYESISFQKALTLENEAALQIFIQSESLCFIYILHETPDNKIFLVKNAALQSDSELYLPDAEEDFILSSSSGTDRFYVIASSLRQTTLESLLKSSNKDGLVSKPDAVKDEILRIRQNSSKIALDGEKPVAMGGVTRGSKQQNATQMEGKEVYVKTITIKHQ